MLRLKRMGREVLQLCDASVAVTAGAVMLSLVEGEPAFVSACFLFGLLVGSGNRLSGGLALTGVAAVQLATWPEHFRLEGLFPIFSAILAALAIRLCPFQLRYGATVGVVLVGIGLTVAIDRGFIEPSRYVTALIATLFGIGGLILGRLIASSVKRDAAWSSANIHKVTRDLLLGRITTGMIHDLAQPINVVSMANGNLSYIISNLSKQESAEDLLKERVERIAGQTDKAAHLLHNFRSFGRADQEPSSVLTIRDALERTRVATMSNVRHGGVGVEFRGDALDCMGGEHLAVLQLVMAGTLLSAFAGFTNEARDRLNGTVVIEARLEPGFVRFDVSALDEHNEVMPVSLPDPALAWLLEEVISSVGGRIGRADQMKRATQVYLMLPRKS